MKSKVICYLLLVFFIVIIGAALGSMGYSIDSWEYWVITVSASILFQLGKLYGSEQNI